MHCETSSYIFSFSFFLLFIQGHPWCCSICYFVSKHFIIVTFIPTNTTICLPYMLKLCSGCLFSAFELPLPTSLLVSPQFLSLRSCHVYPFRFLFSHFLVFVSLFFLLRNLITYIPSCLILILYIAETFSGVVKRRVKNLLFQIILHPSLCYLPLHAFIRF